MIAWSIETALTSGLFAQVIVSTDNEEIATVAVAEGAQCPFVRPVAFADDFATTGAVMAHATRWAVDAGLAPDSVCCIYATAPFLAVDDLRRGCEWLETGEWSYTMAVTDFPAPIFRAFRAREDCGLEMFFPEHSATRSQDLPPALHDAAQFYWGRPAAWLEERRLFDRWTRPVLIPRWRVQDIDTPDDWTRAEKLLALVRGHHG